MKVGVYCFVAQNDKVRRTQWIPACAGMTSALIALCALLFALCLPNGQTALNFYLSKYLNF